MKKVVLSVCISLLFNLAFSQSTSETSEKYVPTFGFNLGLNQSVIYTSNSNEQFEIKNAPGFRLGVLVNFPISKKWSISPKAELSFNNGKIIENNITYRVDPYNLDFMAHFKYRIKGSERKLNPYFSFGPNIKLPLSSNFDGVLYNTKTSLALDFSFGFDIDVNYFIISPEIRFSGGLTDIRKSPSGETLRGSNAMFVINFSSK